MADDIEAARSEIARLQGELHAARQELTAGSSERATLRGRITKLENEAESAKTERTAAEVEARTKHEAEIAALNGQLDQAGTHHAFRTAAIAAGVHNADDALALADLSGVKKDKDGKPAGVAEALEALKASRPYLFGEAPKPGVQRGQTTGPNGPPSPVPGGPVDARTLSDTEYAAARQNIVNIRR